MSEQSVAAAKAALRRRILAARWALPPARRAQDSSTARGRLIGLAPLRGVRTVLGYAAFGSELNIDAWLQELADAGLGVFLPFVDRDVLAVSRVRDLRADLAPGFRGVREPLAGRRPEGRIDRLDVAVVPGVAFDRFGARLGYGGGHFDRLLARLSPQTLVIGAAFDVQIVTKVPVEDHDQSVDLVVTPSRVLDCRVRRSSR